MAKNTIHDLVMAALEDEGYAENKAARSSKYTEMIKPGFAQKLYLGSGGAVRMGRTVAASVPVPERRKRHLVDRGTELLK